jgi:hypothetical protein
MKARTTSTRSVAEALLRAGYLMVLGLVLASLPRAMAQQYPPPAYPGPGQPPAYPGQAQPPAYPGPGYGYGGPTTPPPPLQREAVPPPPRAAMVWTPGFWNWGGGGWVWVPGRYMARPYPHAAWIPGHWRPRGPSWVWVPGHWRG